jgi:microcin C transport system ATP-binding protein
MPLLEVADLSVRFAAQEGRDVEAVRGVSFTLDRGETLALVGESGSGKSVTALSVLQLLPYPKASHPTGSIRLEGTELVGRGDPFMRQVRGDRIGMIFQEPMTSLNPLHDVERQVSEPLFVHKRLSRTAARARVLELLRLVRLPDPESRLRSYPHQLSGGQRQRVMIAMALANEPDILIADEPTTALDVTIQAQILQLLQELQARLGMAILLITHDLTIVRKVADRVAVMRHGLIVEQAPTAQLFAAPEHPYTRHLLASEPKGTPGPADPSRPTVAEGRDVKVHFPIQRGLLRRTVGHIKAVDGVSLAVREGETVGVVGESGSGKTTLGLALLRLISSKGTILFGGQNIQGRTWRQLRALRREMQVVFQDPYGSLSPRLSVAQIVEEGLLVHRLAPDASARRARVARILEEVGIDPRPWTATRTSSPAASASASASPAPSSWSPASSSSTSPPPPSTSPSRPSSWSCSATSSAAAAWPTCSSATTSGW